MLTLIARIIFILAAGFGLRALAGGPSSRAGSVPTRRCGAEGRRGPAAPRAENLGAAEKGPLAAGQTPATFASFGGSAVSAAVAGKAPVDGVVERMGASGRTSGGEGDASAAPALADPDPNGPTPPAADREGLGRDALTEKHHAPAFEADFRSVDYGGARPAWPHRDADAPDDGWTVPDPATDHRVAVPSDSPAAFKGGGGAAPVRGAPEAETAALQRDAADGAAAPERDAAEVDGTAGFGSSAVPERGAAEDSHDAHPASAADVTVHGQETSVPPAASAPSMDPVASADTASLAPAPAGLDAPRGGVPDDLTRIAGIGPSIERLLFESGIFHFDQIAGWSAADISWADRLTGFDGRAAREKWVEQARGLGVASGE